MSRGVVRTTVEAWGRKRKEPYKVRFAKNLDADKPSLQESIAASVSAFDLPKLGGGRLAYRPGVRPLLLVFWASWCAPCLAEAPHIERLHKLYAGKLDVIAVSIDDDIDSDEVADAVKKLSLSYPVALEPEAQLIKKLAGEANIPLTIVADAQGTMQFHHANFEPGDEVALATAVAKVVATKP